MKSLKESREWLANRLRSHPGESTEETLRAAKEQGFKKSKIKQAKKELGVITVNDYKEGVTLNWYWMLPLRKVT